MDLRYRPDIDALRGIAVVSVMMFHYGFNEFPGGFVGVDVFFVISGYLITGIISTKLNSGEFTFSSFYLRRARRLLPSFLIVLAACFIGGFIYLSPPHFERFSEALLYSLFYATNIFYIGEVGYFDIDALFKPLLHTWSLSVEGQIYLIWPMFLLLTSGRKILWPLGIASLFLLSIGGAVIFSDSDSSYYMPVFRLYEFIIGSLTFFAAKRSVGGTAFNTILYFVGAAFIAISVFGYDRHTPFPSFYAILPCIGTAFAIYSFPKSASALHKIANNRVLVGIGEISYPLYLVHWPILVFYHYSVFRLVTIPEKFALITASAFFAYLLYRFVEIPIRKNMYVSNKGVHFNSLRAKQTILATLIISLISLPVLSLSASTGEGWGWRFASADTDRMSRQLKISHDNRHAYFKANNLISTGTAIGQPSRILIVGDSHAKNLFNSLHLNKGKFLNVDLFAFELDEMCHLTRDHIIKQSLASQLIYGKTTFKIKPECKAKKEELLSLEYAQQADTIIIASHWTKTNLQFVEATIDFFKSFSGARIILYGSNHLPFDPPTLILTKGLEQDVSRKMYLLDRSEQIFVNETIRNAASSKDVEYYDVISQVCRDDLQECNILSPKGEILYQNDNHWTHEGEQYFGAIVADVLMKQE